LTSTATRKDFVAQKACLRLEMIAHGLGAVERGGGLRATTLVVHSRATHEEWCSSRQRRAIRMFVSLIYIVDMVQLTTNLVGTFV
jgi:hypothetical protein